MCSAYYLKRIERKAERAAAAMLEKLRLEAHEAALPLVRPTDPAPVIAMSREGPFLLQARWGLVPHWAKDTTIARQCFNARSETVHEKPAFRDAFRGGRVLVPASGWFEWTGPKGKKRAGGAIPEKAQQMFMTVCATCHGAYCTGKGPASETLNPKPRNYTDAAWQATVTDEDLRKTILLGGQGVGKSPMMPGNPQLKDDTETLDGLVQIIRGFGKK